MEQTKYPELKTGMFGEMLTPSGKKTFVVVGNYVVFENGLHYKIKDVKEFLDAQKLKITFLTDEACDFNFCKQAKERLTNLVRDEVKFPKWNERDCNKEYYFIDDNGRVYSMDDRCTTLNNAQHEVFNYFPVSQFSGEDMTEISRLQTMQRALWKFAKYNKCLCKDTYKGVFITNTDGEYATVKNCFTPLTEVFCFTSDKWAKKAIEEVVKPLMAKWVEEDNGNAC